MSFGTSLTKMKMSCAKHAPEILLVAGTVGFIATIVTAVKSTSKAKEKLAEAKNELDTIEEALTTENCDFSEEEAKTERKNCYIRTGWEMIKIYALPVALGVATLACFYTSHGIMVNRNVAIAGALSSVTALFKDYRSRVVDKYGEEVDFELSHGCSEIEVTTDDGNGKIKTEKHIIADGKDNLYTRYMLPTNPNFVDNGGSLEMIEYYKNGIQDVLNDRLETYGVVAFNEALEEFNFPKDTEEGIATGWTRGHDIKIMITPCKIVDEEGDIVEAFAFDFNVQGPIHKAVPKKKNKFKRIA